jgi:hypothetical protein
LEGIGFNTTSSPKVVCETFMDMNNPGRDEPMHKNDTTKFLEDTNQGIPTHENSCAFTFFGNAGATLMTTLNFLGLNVGLSVWLWTTLNVKNSLDASHISTLCQGHRMDVDTLPFASVKSTPPPPPPSSSSESYATSNQKSKWNRKRKSKKKSPNPTSHAGDMQPSSLSYVGGEILVTTSNIGRKSPTSASHVGDVPPAFASHDGGKVQSLQVILVICQQPL